MFKELLELGRKNAGGERVSETVTSEIDSLKHTGPSTDAQWQAGGISGY